ncbi:hypothetical protein N657DRAFT_686337 [Parathielavia appendiculata]|uniref:Uncharacterized protein n=1 Tax=Parathielavia appendiculata TaxID=2587402 RepID=A0AAN6U9E0_9PEZI|nr:hypothetical protein N657DRAFT_686337 [Parathielavia appendiculata]
MASESLAVMRLQHRYAISPITALAFYELRPERVLLLAGEDTWLKVYDVETSQLLGQLNIFSSQPIHGIHISQPKAHPSRSSGILIWGGHSVALLPHSSLTSLIAGQPTPQPTESRTPDWIYDGILFPSDSDSNPSLLSNPTGALVTARNEILPFSFPPKAAPKEHHHLLFGPLTSPSRPILYSANLALLTPDTVLVAGGTVFGEIIVWKYHVDGFTKPGFGTGSAAAREGCQWELLYVFTGHEGSIFGVSISPEVEGIGGRRGVGGRLLVSCSDDRTVRVWDITEWEGKLAADGSESMVKVDLDEARETGFGGSGSENSETRRANREDGARCVAVAMGHVSRIWHVKFGRWMRALGKVEVLSFGEDCSRQRWELDVDLEWWCGGRSLSERRAGSLRHRGASTCHSGKNIWSVAVLDRGDSEPLVATGGADGKIVISGRHSGSSGADYYQDLDLTLSLNEVLRSVPQPARAPETKDTKHAFQRYAFLSDTVMATTASGRLFLATMGDTLSWQEAALPEAIIADLKPYNVVKSPARDTVLLGSASGKVYLVRKDEVRAIATLPAKVSDIILLDNAPSHALTEQPWSVIINVLGLDHALLLQFDPSTNTCTIDSRKIRLPEHCILTAAALYDGTLILGSRTGSLTACTVDAKTGDLVPAVSRKDCKTRDAITCIVPIPVAASQFSFLATCRDGKYRIYTLSLTASVSFTLQHEISPPLNTLEGAFFTTPSPAPTSTTPHKKSELILQGFHGPNFLTYNDSTRSILSSIPCGGAHRPFATLCSLSNPGRMRFVFSKAGDLRVVSQSAEGEKVLRSGGHGREIKSVASSYFCTSTPPYRLPITSPEADIGFSTPSTADEGEILVATAAEDTTIRIWRHPYRPEDTASAANQNTSLTTKMDCLAIVQGHSAGIQTLRFFSPAPRPPNPGNLNSNSSSTRPAYLLSSAGSEELFLWRISRIDSPVYDALAVVREAVWDDQSPDRDLRIVDFDVAAWSRCQSPSPRREQDRDQDVASDSEKNYDRNDDGNEEGMVITMVLSDSNVRSYIYSPDTTKSSANQAHDSGSASRGRVFKLLATGRYTGACPTQARHLTTDAASGTVDVLTAFTDGHVAVWRSRDDGRQEPGEFRLALVVRLHQSSIKSLYLSFPSPSPSSGAKGSGGRWFVATGGDDNALGFLDLIWDESKEEYVVLGRYRVREAHAAAITGLSVVRGEESGVTEVATVSNDQRVKLWRVERSVGGGIRVALVDNRYSSVADAGDLELIAPGKLMVGGVGMELWDVSRS